MTDLRIAITADLHWGTHDDGDAATRRLAGTLHADPPDGLILAGDIGAGDDFARCLALFADLPGWKAAVPGNHDIWVTSDDTRGDSLQVYREHLPRLCVEAGFHYLDASPLVLPAADLAIVGSINWYDYSWALEELKVEVPDWAERVKTKRFTRGRHNDARFVRWPFDDVGFTAAAVETLDAQLADVLGKVGRAVVVTHHPPFRGLNFPEDENVITLDRLLWTAFSGNAAMEAVLARYAERIALAFCGHTHRARENELAGIRGYNVGGDYHFKRLLLLDWPAGTVSVQEFHDDGLIETE